MGTLEEAMQTVQAAFRPDADAATKAQAATLLRSLAAVLDGPPGAPVPAPPPALPQPDLLGALIDRFRSMLPAEAQPSVPRLDIPLIPVPRR